MWEAAEILSALRRDGELRRLYRAFLATYPNDPRAAEVRARLTVLGPATEGASPPASTRSSSTSPGSNEAGPAATAATDAESDKDGGSIVDEDWFWPVVVGGAVVVLIAVLALIQPGAPEQAIPGDDGVVVMTLLDRRF